jgi:hypothetical protein
MSSHRFSPLKSDDLKTGSRFLLHNSRPTRAALLNRTTVQTGPAFAERLSYITKHASRNMPIEPNFLLPIALHSTVFARSFVSDPRAFCNCIDRQVCSERPGGASEKEAPPEPWFAFGF